MEPRKDSDATQQSGIGKAPEVFVMGQPSQPAINNGELNQPAIGSGLPKLDIDPDPYKKPDNPKNKWMIGGLVAFGAILLIAILAFIFTRPKPKPTVTTVPNKTSQQAAVAPQTSESLACAKKWVEFSSKSLETRFCYPESWGTAQAQDAKLDSSDRGTRQAINFSAKPNVHLNLASQDWSTDASQDGACSKAIAQAFPDVTNFAPKWVTTTSGTVVNSAYRGIELSPDNYLLRESVDISKAENVCMLAYSKIDGDVYDIATGTMGAAFGGGVTSVQAHIAKPTVLISAADRADFTTVTKSIKRY